MKEPGRRWRDDNRYASIRRGGKGSNRISEGHVRVVGKQVGLCSARVELGGAGCSPSCVTPCRPFTGRRGKCVRRCLTSANIVFARNLRGASRIHPLRSGGRRSQGRNRTDGDGSRCRGRRRVGVLRLRPIRCRQVRFFSKTNVMYIAVPILLLDGVGVRVFDGPIRIIVVVRLRFRATRLIEHPAVRTTCLTSVDCRGRLIVVGGAHLVGAHCARFADARFILRGVDRGKVSGFRPRRVDRVAKRRRVHERLVNEGSGRLALFRVVAGRDPIVIPTCAFRRSPLRVAINFRSSQLHNGAFRVHGTKGNFRVLRRHVTRYG